MKTETVIAVTRKLIGDVNPVGESTADYVRLENLKVLCGVVECLINDIEVVSGCTNSKEISVNRAGRFAHDFLKELKQ